ncbi:MAG: response regulator [Caulobacteraceae bacterium]|nr:response regulator [Caulobacteraceae bacterium]
MSEAANARTVHIIDDDDAVRESVAFLCATAGFQAETYASPTAFLAVAANLHGGCILTDVRMPEMDGLALVRSLKEQGVALPVIVMTGHGDVPMAVQAMKEGAADFLEKPFDDEVMLGAIRSSLSAGGRGTPAGDDPTAAKLALLSERERQVLDGLIEGQANKVIALNLGISPRTVEIYRAKLMAKMEAASLAELVRMVVARPTA